MFGPEGTEFPVESTIPAEIYQLYDLRDDAIVSAYLKKCSEEFNATTSGN